MASTYSNLKIELMGTGDQSGTWGTTTNTNLGTAIEEAITGSADVTFANADVTLTLTNTNTAQTARNLRLNLTGSVSAARNLIVPAIEKQYIVNNGLTFDITVKNSTGTGIAVPAGKSMILFNTGVNVVETSNAFATGSIIPVANGGTGQSSALVAGGVLYGASTTAAAVTAAGTAGRPLVSNGASAPAFAVLGVTGGGTGVTTSTGSGNVVLSTSPTLVTPVLGTPTSGTLTSCTGLPLTTGVTGTLPVANGGTGVTTSTGSGANVLSTSPTLVTPLLGTPTSGTLTNCTGLPIATGVSGLGTGVATFLATPSSANLASAVTNETGSGSLVFGTSPSLTTPSIAGATVTSTLTSSGTLAVTGEFTLDGAAGTTGQVMVSAGSGNTPTWGTIFVSGMIMMWSGSIASIPSGWLLCNGTSGTPDLRNRFVIGAFADAAGVASTTITGSSTQTGGTKDAIVVSHSHSMNDPGHSHTYETRGGTPPQTGSATPCWSGVVTANSGSSATGISINSTGSSGTNENLPPYYALAFIMKA